MDTRKYSAGVIRPEDLHEGPRVEKIINIFEHEKHGCLVLELESGDQFYCWNSYVRILNKAWGYESENWLNQEVEFSLGHYFDKKTETEKETIDLRAVSPAKSGTNGDTPSKPPLSASKTGGSRKDDLSDDIPF